MEKKTVLLVGATGLVGSHILSRLLENETWGRVIALTRSAIPDADALSTLDNRIVDFGRPDEWQDQVAADQTICALGTTIKKAGSREAFRRVDFEYPLMIAQAALNAGCRHFLLVSAMGADANSPVFYNRIKGELEAAVLGLGFTGVSIFRPSLLLGDRREFRPAEAVGQVLSRWLGFAIPKRYRPVHARTLAAAVVRVAATDVSGNRVLTSEAIAEWGAA
ncbi:MAG: oxidoreductase [Desulfobacteraceae bacterium]|jgi:uncharacterized protein YbjT (DUF2867 family)|nr:oxidoreductase [Desulfobacteraceae bacterium]